MFCNSAALAKVWKKKVRSSRDFSVALFSWSDVKPTVGQSVKVSELVGVNRKGKLKYKVSGVCKLRNGTVSFLGSGKCRVTVQLSQKSGKKGFIEGLLCSSKRCVRPFRCSPQGSF
jgi:hypothetical protein